MVKMQRIRECKVSSSKWNINHTSYQCTGLIVEKKCRKMERVDVHIGKDMVFALTAFEEHTK